MKLRINYDLVDKISEAKQGYSLKRCVKRVFGMTAVSGSMSTLNHFIAQTDPKELLFIYPIHMAIHTGYTILFSYGCSSIIKSLAVNNLEKLTRELGTICVRTDYESLLNTYTYKTKYRINTDSKLPRVEQKRYMKIPVKDEYFGDREIPILQEHVIGSRNYDLSIGEPEEKKVLVLSRALMQK